MPPQTGDHNHDDFVIPDDPGEMYGGTGTVNMRPVGALIGATYDECGPCAEDALGQIADEPARIRRVMELAFVVADRFSPAGIRTEMVSNAADTPAYGPEFRAIMRVGMQGQNRALPTIKAMTHAQRRNAARTAADVIVSIMPKPPCQDVAEAAGRLRGDAGQRTPLRGSDSHGDAAR